jgi:ubiquinone/menaquinone biosynthesis C-methylase UbiE
MMEQDKLANHQKYCERVKTFRDSGYDIVAERNHIVKIAQPIKGRILEVGTGKGYFTLALAQKGYAFTSVDLSEDEQKYARMNVAYEKLSAYVNFMIADAHQLPWSDGHFDVCFACNLMHHLNRPLKVIDELLRVTTKSGKIIITDFTKQGFDLLDKIHQNEGRSHSTGACTFNEIVDYASAKRHPWDRFQTKCQEILIIKKRS